MIKFNPEYGRNESAEDKKMTAEQIENYIALYKRQLDQIEKDRAEIFEQVLKLQDLLKGEGDMTDDSIHQQLNNLSELSMKLAQESLERTKKIEDLEKKLRELDK